MKPKQSYKWNIIPYGPKLKQYSRDLRNNATKSERILWRYLRRRQMLGYKFLRQRPLVYFIADFYCKELKLVIELDGYTHDFKDVQRKDKRKDEVLATYGIHVLRFKDDEVYYEIDHVLHTIKTRIEALQ